MTDEFEAAACEALGHPLEHEEIADDGRGGLTVLLLCPCGHRREEKPR